MKKLFTLCMLISFTILMGASYAFAQSNVTSKWYITTVDLTVSKSDIPTTDTSDTINSYRVRPGTKFNVINISKNNNYEIVFGFYGRKKNDTNSANASTSTESEHFFTAKLRNVPVGLYTKQQLTQYPADSAFISAWANFKTFYITPTDLSNKCVVYYTKNLDFTWGASTMPLKIRFGNSKNIYSAYEQNLNLGLTFGLKYSIPSTKEQSLDALVIAGVSAVNLDSVSLKSAAYYNSKITTTNAVTCGFGIVYQYSSFQVGVFTGIDHIPGQLGREWLNEDRPWLGIGIGLALFNNQSTTTGSTPSNSLSP